MNWFDDSHPLELMNFQRRPFDKKRLIYAIDS